MQYSVNMKGIYNMRDINVTKLLYKGVALDYTLYYSDVFMAGGDVHRDIYSENKHLCNTC